MKKKKNNPKIIHLKSTDQYLTLFTQTHAQLSDKTTSIYYYSGQDNISSNVEINQI